MNNFENSPHAMNGQPSLWEIASNQARIEVHLENIRHAEKARQKYISAMANEVKRLSSEVQLLNHEVEDFKSLRKWLVGTVTALALMAVTIFLK